MSDIGGQGSELQEIRQFIRELSRPDPDIESEAIRVHIEDLKLIILAWRDLQEKQKVIDKRIQNNLNIFRKFILIGCTIFFIWNVRLAFLNWSPISYLNLLSAAICLFGAIFAWGHKIEAGSDFPDLDLFDAEAEN